MSGEPAGLVTPLDTFLAEQACLTAVERFSALHDSGVADHGGLDRGSRYYKDLIPLEKPRPGEQYGFEVDLDACTGCKACVTACHNLNGLDEGESWRAVGLLHGGTPVEPLQQSVTTACHHCVDPACLNGCPTRAFDKDPVTGIVSHREERCLGCGYCTWTCPYEVPRLNEARGVIRKCDMCQDRLAVGEAPGCVQACPNGAIRITTVDVAVLVAAAPGEALLPTAPPSSMTVPTTSYHSHWGMPGELLAADHLSVAPAEAHSPLAAMLVLTEVGIGSFVAGALFPGTVADWLRGGGLALAAAGAAVSLGHLGHPGRAWRALAGLRRSWLSREVAALGAFVALGALALALGGGTLTAAASVVGIITLVSSAMLYVVTGRPCWGARHTFARFGTTALVGALASALAAGAAPWTGWLLALAMVPNLGSEAAVFRHLGSPALTDLRRSAMILVGPLRSRTVWRLTLGLAGGVLLPVAVALGAGPTRLLALAAWALVVAGEVVERSQFFRAAAWTAMPGVLD
ncbi:MAG: DmsC/YnfH family molybdoenzyme membrane anchor subunit [Acidimicrobiales bacterium]